MEQSTGRGKKNKSNDKVEGNPKEVVHVRARRGQATDSHSIAERVCFQENYSRIIGFYDTY